MILSILTMFVSARDKNIHTQYCQCSVGKGKVCKITYLRLTFRPGCTDHDHK